MEEAHKLAHGPIACRACWPEPFTKHRILDGGKAQIQNDPGYWGSADPSVLVLGMMKGFTQSNRMPTSPSTFDGVAFAGFRPRLLQSMQAIGLMRDATDIDAKLRATETEYGFASVIRCSLTAISSKEGATSASSKVIAAINNLESQKVLNTCIMMFLTRLSKRTRLVVFLGNDDRYVAYMNKVMGRHFPDFMAWPSGKGLVYRASGRFFVHTAHPSGSNGHFGAFISANPNPNTV